MAQSTAHERTTEEPDGRPAKKARLELPTTIILDGPGTPVDDMDDASIYGVPSSAPTPQPRQDDVAPAAKQLIEDQPLLVADIVPNGGIPGLGLLGNSVGGVYYQAPTPEGERCSLGLEHMNRHDKTEENISSLALETQDTDETVGIRESIETGDIEAVINPDLLARQAKCAEKAKASLDPGFLKAAETNKSDPNAEWQLDSSDAEFSSSDDFSDESDSDDSQGSEEGEDDDDYQLLGPEEQARILMQEEGGSDDEDGNKQGKGGPGPQLRTKNEIVEVKVEKPNINVTSEMKIEELGTVDQIVDNLVLVKAKISGEYQVLDFGSLLCFKNRKVLGVVGETLGRVQQPLYSIRFNSAAEIAEEGVTLGTKVFYVEQHSTYVFTQPLKALKGSDASNIHDEEVREDELEFSDDEAEAAYKRRLKQEKESRRGKPYQGHAPDGRQGERGANGRGNNPKRSVSGMKGQAFGKDDPDGDDLYTPLARPTNLHELMGNGEAPVEMRDLWALPTRPPHGADRSREWGRGGRAGRVGRGGRGITLERGDRRGVPGGSPEYAGRNYGAEHFNVQDQSPPPMQSPSHIHSFHATTQQQAASVPYYAQQPVQFFQQSPQYSSQATQNTHQQEQPHFSQFYSQHSEHQPYRSWAQAPISPQYPTFPFSVSPQGYLPQSPGAALPSPGGTLPPGSFVNPAFFRNQQQNQWARSQPQTPHVHPQAQSGAGRMSPKAEAAFKAAQEKLDILKGLSGARGGSSGG